MKFGSSSIWRRHDPGDRAQHRGEAPADAQHQRDADPEQPARRRADRRGPHPEPEPREAEEDEHDRDADQRDADHAEVLDVDHNLADVDGLAAGTGSSGT